MINEVVAGKGFKSTAVNIFQNFYQLLALFFHEL